MPSSRVGIRDYRVSQGEGSKNQLVGACLGGTTLPWERGVECLIPLGNSPVLQLPHQKMAKSSLTPSCSTLKLEVCVVPCGVVSTWLRGPLDQSVCVRGAERGIGAWGLGKCWGGPLSEVSSPVIRVGRDPVGVN